MKKVVKKTLIYGGSALVLGGIVTGITVPVLNAKNKVHESSIPTGIKWEDQATSKSKVKDFQNSADENGVKETNLLNKAKYQLSFKLYQEEQAASFDFQKADFKYEMYQKTKDAIQAIFDNETIATNFNKDGSTIYDQDFINNPLMIKEVEADFDKFIKWAEKQAQNVIDNPDLKLSQKQQEQNKEKAKNLKNKLHDLKEEHTKINNKLKNIGTAKNHPKIDFNLSSISSDYPRLMLPLSVIKDKQEKIFDDGKDAFIKGFETKEKGEAQWPSNLIKSYNGATTKEEALDYLVSNETQNIAFKRFKYKINADFTIEKIITGIYNNILGITTLGFDSQNSGNKLDQATIVDSNSKIKVGANETTLFANKDFINSKNLKKSLQEKVYFLGTESLVAKLKVNGGATSNFFAPNLNDQATKTYIDGLVGSKIAKVENAIIGLTPNSEDPRAAWQYGSQIKDKLVAIRNALKLFVTGDNANPKYITGYHDAESIFGSDNDLSNTLIAQITATQDSSRYKGGDYGWKSQLDNVKGMTAGFGVGLIAAFRDMSLEDQKSNLITTSIAGNTFGDKMKSVMMLFEAIRTGLNNFITVKGGTNLSYPTSSKSITAIDQYNRTLNHFTTKVMLKDNDILKYIGAAVKKMIDTKNIFIDKNNNKTNVLPPVIDIGEDPQGSGHVYIFTTEEYGMHLVRIVKGQSILTQIGKDLAKIANKQDLKESSTDYVSLLNNALTTNKQMEKLLGLKLSQSGPKKGTPELSLNEYTKVIKDNYKKISDKYDDADKMEQDIAWLLKSSKTKDIIQKVKASVPSTYKDWLIKLMDNKIMLEPDSSGLAPEDIYNWAIKEEEK